MKCPGQAAFEAFYVGSSWHKAPAARKRVWKDVAQAALDAHLANTEAPKTTVVTHGGLEHGDVVVFTSQLSDNLPWIVAQATWTKGHATLRLSRRNGGATAYMDDVPFGEVRRINPTHLGPPRVEVIVPPKGEAPSCNVKGCGA